MNKIVSLYLSRKDVPARMDVVQGATDPGITFVLEDYEPDLGADAQIYVKKAESEVYNACTIDGNEVSFNPTTTTFDQVGPCVAQLEIISGGKVAVSYRIYVVVEPNTIDNEAIEATNEFTALQQALLAVDDITEWKAKTDQNTTDITAINNALPRKVDYLNNTTTVAMVGQVADDRIRLQVEGPDGNYTVGFKDNRILLYNRTTPGMVMDIYPEVYMAYGGGINGTTTTTIPTGVWKTAASVTLNKGVYDIDASMSFYGNDVGVRQFALSTSADSGTAYTAQWAMNDKPPGEGLATYLKCSALLNVLADNTTFYFNVRQTSGGNLDCYPRWSCAKVR